MKKFWYLNLLAKGPQKFTKMAFSIMMCGNFRQKNPTPYQKLGPFVLKNFKNFTFLTREQVK